MLKVCLWVGKLLSAIKKQNWLPSRRSMFHAYSITCVYLGLKFLFPLVICFINCLFQFFKMISFLPLYLILRILNSILLILMFLIFIPLGVSSFFFFLGLHNDPVSWWLLGWPNWRRRHFTNSSGVLVHDNILDAAVGSLINRQIPHHSVHRIISSFSWHVSRYDVKFCVLYCS